MSNPKTIAQSLQKDHTLRFSDFIIIGAQKAGTSFLYSYLAEHPNVQPALTKEVHYFDNNYSKGPEWYADALRSSGQNSIQTIFGEASPYYFYHPLAAQRIHNLIPDVKLIVLLRNPVERAFSHYQHNLKNKRESLSFNDAIAQENERLKGEEEKLIQNPSYYSLRHQHYSYLTRGLYAEQIRTFLKYFQREQILIFESEDLYQNTNSVFSETINFLELPSWEPKKFEPVHVGNYQDKMDEKTKKELESYFQEHNLQLYKLIGETYTW